MLAPPSLWFAGNPRVQAGLQPASASELEALLEKIGAVARAVGESDQESRGGGNQGQHGRRRLPLGHIRALMARAKANTWVSSAAGTGFVWVAGRQSVCWPAACSSHKVLYIGNLCRPVACSSHK